jgi:hypothetical protein
MAKIGIVSDEQFEQEIANTVITPVPGIIKEVPHRGRKQGDVNVPDGIRKIIGEESVINGRGSAIELAKDFGVSPSSVSAYAKGATSTASYHKPEASLTNYLTGRRQRITKKALRVLHSSLDNITPEKLKDLKTKDVASIAKDMSVIAKNMEPKVEQGSNENKPQFVVYAPQIKDERTYETIIVNDGF